MHLLEKLEQGVPDVVSADLGEVGLGGLEVLLDVDTVPRHDNEGHLGSLLNLSRSGGTALDGVFVEDHQMTSGDDVWSGEVLLDLRVTLAGLAVDGGHGSDLSIEVGRLLADLHGELALGVSDIVHLVHNAERSGVQLLDNLEATSDLGALQVLFRYEVAFALEGQRLAGVEWDKTVFVNGFKLLSRFVGRHIRN